MSQVKMDLSMNQLSVRSDFSRFVRRDCWRINRNFCLVCALYIPNSVDRVRFNSEHARMFQSEFGFAAGQDGVHVAKSICPNCVGLLNAAEVGKRIDFDPPKWNRPKFDHVDCWICNFQLDEINEVCVYPNNASIELPRVRLLRKPDDAESNGKDADALGEEAKRQFRDILSNVANQFNLSLPPQFVADLEKELLP